MQSSLVLIQDEEIQAVLEGEMFSTSTNIIFNFFMKLAQFIMFLIGIRKQGQLVVTNKRVVLEVKSITCCCIPDGSAFMSIPYSGIASVEYGFKAMCVCGLCRKYSLTVTPKSGTSVGFYLKGGEAEASSIANAILTSIN